MLRDKVHEGRQRRLTEFSGPSQGDPVFAVKFERQQSSRLSGQIGLLQIRRLQKRRGQLHAHRFHVSKLAYLGLFVMRLVKGYGYSEPLRTQALLNSRSTAFRFLTGKFFSADFAKATYTSRASGSFCNASRCFRTVATSPRASGPLKAEAVSPYT